MSIEELLDELVPHIQSMAVTGADVPSLLKHIQKVAGRIDCKLLSVQCFSKAFNTGIGSVSSVAGWSGFGGELSDDQVNSLLQTVIEDYLASIKK
jgi:hypothetical protein